MKPLKIKLKDHHADDERFACVKTIVEHYDISMKDAKIIMDDHWHLKEDFATKLEEHLNTHYKKKIESKTVYTKEEVIEILNEIDKDSCGLLGSDYINHCITKFL